jgi:ribosomal-protein-alanine N-acetyltransferase
MGNPYDKVPYIVTDKVILRKIVESDLDGLFEIYSNETIFTYIPGDCKKNKSTADMIPYSS